jgi:hypothetical protein
MTKSVPQTIKRGYSVAANSLGRGLVSLGIGNDALPQHRLSHWLISLTRVHDSMAIADLGVPWWTYKAIDAVEHWLLSQSRRVRTFEYGSGASTLWLADRSAEVHTVEHHGGFFNSMKPAFTRTGNIVAHLVEPNPSAKPEVPSAKSGHVGLDFAKYVSTIDEVGGLFDLIVIDGRARGQCLAAARPHLADGGLVVFDNSLRRRYRDAIGDCGLVERRYFGLTPTLPYPEQTSLLQASS